MLRCMYIACLHEYSVTVCCDSDKEKSHIPAEESVFHLENNKHFVNYCRNMYAYTPFVSGRVCVHWQLSCHKVLLSALILMIVVC